MPISPLPSDQDASGRDLGPEELALVGEAIESGTLTSTKGRFVKQLELEFAEVTGTAHAVACASGGAAVHIAVAALDLDRRSDHHRRDRLRPHHQPGDTAPWHQHSFAAARSG